LLAPHLQSWGWEPTVLTLEPTSYEGGLDPELPKSLPASLRVVRCHAWSAAMTRKVGVGDLGLRSLAAMYRTATQLLEKESFDLLFITIFPAYTALLGPRLAKHFDIPFVVDYQDPWVSAWGQTVGAGQSERADFKSRASRQIALWLEPRVVRSAAAITAVSEGTYRPILERNPGMNVITEAIPIGTEPADFAGDCSSPTGLFDPADGRVHVVSTGTLLPLGFETLRAVLGAVRCLRDRSPVLFDRLRLHFIGTSNQAGDGAVPRVLPVAREIGVDSIVSEYPARLPYSATVRVQKQASALLALGSSESHYTASRIFPLLLARRPLLAAYHDASSVTQLLGRVGRGPSIRLVNYTDDRRADTTVPQLTEAFAAIAQGMTWQEGDVDLSELTPYFASTLAGRLASVFDRAIAQRAA
jgi:hypothetical protein